MTTIDQDLPRPTLAVLSIVGLMAASLWILRPFLPALIWATMIAVSTWPIMLRVERTLWGRRSLAVTVMTEVDDPAEDPVPKFSSRQGMQAFDAKRSAIYDQLSTGGDLMAVCRVAPEGLVYSFLGCGEIRENVRRQASIRRRDRLTFI